MSAGERLVVGQIRGFHGLRGTMRVESLSDRAEDRFDVGAALFVEGSDRQLTIVESGTDTVGWRLRFAEIADKTAAEPLLNAYLEAVVAPGEELPRGEFYWHEVIGATVSAVDGTVLGKVVDIYRAGGAEVAVVQGESGEIDVPLVRAIVRIFAPSRGEIVVDAEALGLDETDDETDEKMAEPENGANGSGTADAGGPRGVRDPADARGTTATDPAER